VRFFVIEAAVLAAVSLGVAAFVFRSARARNVLRTLRNAAWLYIALVFLFSAVELIRRAV
jgi:hypothetical protein